MSYLRLRVFLPLPRPLPRRALRPPEPLRRLGSLRGLIYRTAMGPGAGVRTFIHFMEQPPVLACDDRGRQLYIVGGNYRVTSRGIEG